LAADPAGSLTVRFEALSAWSKAVSQLPRSPVISACPEQRSIGDREHSRTSLPPFSAAKRPPFIAESHTGGALNLFNELAGL
jgi:hypothetical protein